MALRDDKAAGAFGNATIINGGAERYAGWTMEITTGYARFATFLSTAPPQALHEQLARRASASLPSLHVRG